MIKYHEKAIICSDRQNSFTISGHINLIVLLFLILDTVIVVGTYFVKIFHVSTYYYSSHWKLCLYTTLKHIINYNLRRTRKLIVS